MPELLPIRIAAGSIPLVRFAAALVARNNGQLRRRIGRLFVRPIAVLLVAAAGGLRVPPIVPPLDAMFLWPWRDRGRCKLRFRHDPLPLTTHSE